MYFRFDSTYLLYQWRLWWNSYGTLGLYRIEYIKVKQFVLRFLSTQILNAAIVFQDIDNRADERMLIIRLLRGSDIYLGIEM